MGSVAGMGLRDVGSVAGVGLGDEASMGLGQWPTGHPGFAGGLDTCQPGEEAAGEGEQGDFGAEEDPPGPAQLTPISQAAGE